MGLGETVTLGDGRMLAFDDVGDPGGLPVLYVHGTPDSRRARHPDDEIATGLGIRLVAVDRPGAGLSTIDPSGTFGSFADDAVALADHLGVSRWRVLGWSAGAPYALAVAARHPDRVERVAVVAGLVPFVALAEPGLLDQADHGRAMVAELGAEMGAEAFAEVAAPMLVPYPCDDALATEHVLETATPDKIAVLDAVPGTLAAMAAGVVDSVASGLLGLTHDLMLQVQEPDVDWSAVRAPVDLWYATLDRTAPPSFGRWWSDHLADPRLRIVEDAGHLVAISHWSDILTALVVNG